MITIEDALRLAVEAHDGQKDLDGKPVILHPLAVGIAGRNREEVIAGLLHDVVEDTSFTFEDLLERGVDEPIVEALRLLTHTKDMPYEDYVQRIAQSGNDIAIHVKYNDLCHNLKRGRAGGYWNIVAKHEKALAVIEPLIKNES
jgi:(p)ppGpp synthase/HD superfamily hydrolase